MTLRQQPQATTTTPGAGAYGSASAAAQFSRLAPHELAYQELQAAPPPLPVQFFPPLDDDEFEQAVRDAMARIQETVLQTWDGLYADRIGHIPDAQFLQVWSSHEPLFIADPATGAPHPNPWLAQLSVISSRQVATDLTRYARVRTRMEQPA